MLTHVVYDPDDPSVKKMAKKEAERWAERIRRKQTDIAEKLRDQELCRELVRNMRLPDGVSVDDAVASMMTVYGADGKKSKQKLNL